MEKAFRRMLRARHRATLAQFIRGLRHRLKPIAQPLPPVAAICLGLDQPNTLKTVQTSSPTQTHFETPDRICQRIKGDSMNPDSLRSLVAWIFVLFIVLMANGPAQAAITCNISSNGFTTGYRSTDPGTTIAAASFTIACTRASTDVTSQSYTVKVNNGLYANGINNQAASLANRIKYDVYTDSGCATQWKGATTLGGTLNFGSALSASQTIPFWGCIAAGLNPAPGTYTDTVTLLPSIGTNATFGVTIVTPANCTVSTALGNVNFNYVSFQTSVATASTPFTATCSKDLPYTMALDATSGTMLGLNYALTLSANSATGTGLAQTFSVDGTMPPGQVGTCSTASCTQTAKRTLTVSY